MRDHRDFVAAVEPLVSHLGGSIIAVGDHTDDDEPIVWADQVVGYVRREELHGALARMVDAIEIEQGTPLADLDRAMKQAAVRRLDDQGAFLLRGAVETVAAQMGVSKVTLYSYLNAIKS